MGLVHTGIRSKLGVEKVRKTTMVGMDIKRAHLEAGLLHIRGPRNFTSEARAQALNHTSSLADCIDTGDQVDELIGFEQLSEHLIAGAAAANLDRDIGDDYDDPDELPPHQQNGILLAKLEPLLSSTY